MLFALRCWITCAPMLLLRPMSALKREKSATHTHKNTHTCASAAAAAAARSMNSHMLMLVPLEVRGVSSYTYVNMRAIYGLSKIYSNVHARARLHACVAGLQTTTTTTLRPRVIGAAVFWEHCNLAPAEAPHTAAHSDYGAREEQSNTPTTRCCTVMLRLSAARSAPVSYNLTRQQQTSALNSILALRLSRPQRRASHRITRKENARICGYIL